MSFLDRFSEPHRRLFESSASRVDLLRGQYLLRRGEPGGDLYMLVEGSLEVVDGRSTPEIILAVVPVGDVVGEMAFVDDSPRSANVRAADDTVVLHWSREDLRRLLHHNPDLAAAFYENVARLTAERIREATALAAPRKPANRAGLARAQDEARYVAEAAKEAFLEAETRLRHDASDRTAQRQVRAVLDRLEKQVHELMLSYPEPGTREEAARVLCRELHPYLVRSALAERCIRRPSGGSATAEILAHVLVDQAGGDGQLGELLDRWLLDRPTLAAMRALRTPFVDIVVDALPRHRNRRVLVINAGTGSLVAGLTDALGHAPTVLTVLDQSRDALAFVDESVGSGTVEVRTVLDRLVQLALGRTRHRFAPQDCVVIHGLVEYMPDRLVVSFLSACADLLAPGGVVVTSALGPSDDDDLLDRLLAWPTIRRTSDHLERLFAAAGLDVASPPDLPSPALVRAGSPGAPPDVATPRPSREAAPVAPARGVE